MTVHQPRLAALQRLGELRQKRAKPLNSGGSDKLRAYYERHATKNADGRLSQRHIDAFVGLCSCVSQQNSEVPASSLLEGLESITTRWPDMSHSCDQVLASPTALKHVSKAAFSALLRLTKADSNISKLVHGKLLELISKVEYIPKESRATSSTLVVLIGFLEIASEMPECFTFSDFISTTRALNSALVKICSPSSSEIEASSFEALGSAFDPTLNYVLQFQDQASRFVLEWCEHACALSFSTSASKVWSVFSDGERHSTEEDLVDAIVWETAISHAQVQYDLHNLISLSTISEVVLGRTLKTACIATISLNRLNDLLLSWLSILAIDASDLDDSGLGRAILDVLSALAIRFPSSTSEMIRLLKDIITRAPRPLDDDQPSLASSAARELLRILQQFSKDDLISTMYGFANTLNGPSVGEYGSSVALERKSVLYDTASLSSRNSEGERSARNAVEAISVFGTQSTDSQLSALALVMLIQKFPRVVDSIKRKIVTELAAIALHCTEKNILRVSNFYSDLEESSVDTDMALAIQSARDDISRHLVAISSASCHIYLESLLKAGTTRASKSPRTRNMTTLLVPLGTLLKDRDNASSYKSPDLLQLFHNFWFQLVISGYTVNSKMVLKDLVSLKEVALGSPSLALETRTDSFESDLESYPLLRQAHDHEQTQRLQAVIESFVPNTKIRTLPFSKVVYVNAVALLESLKAQAGIASGSLPYYRHSSLEQSEVSAIISSISLQNTNYMVHAINKDFESVRLDRELHDLVVGTCDLTAAIRRQANLVIDHIVQAIPSAFCSSLAMTTLLESVTLLGWACYEEYSDKYSPNYEFRSSRTDLQILVSDSFTDRQELLMSAQNHARRWLERAMLESASDVRTLLASYISATEDHSSGSPSDRGKMLAIEFAMRSSQLDQPVDHLVVRDSSDAFLGELTLRHLQSTANYRSTEVAEGQAVSLGQSLSSKSMLRRSMDRKFIPFSDLREQLCLYTARLLHSDENHSGNLRRLAEIPFNIFTIAAMRLATSLWSRVVNERPGLQSDLLAEVAKCWAATIRHRRGLFSRAHNHDNPFSRVMEYAPTDKEAIAKEGKSAKTLLEPHLNVLRFFSSHLAAAQNTSIESLKILLRIIRCTMKVMKANKTSNHIFARELHLRIVHIGVKLKSMLGALGLKTVGTRFEILIYDSALSIFAGSPRWVFGSDIMQMRTDRQLIITLSDMIRPELRNAGPSVKQSKLRLLSLLLETEASRIDLWLNPMSQSRAIQPDTTRVISLLDCAWKTSPAIAISLVQRYSSPTVRKAVRELILRQPWKAIQEPYAADYILGTALPTDASSALKYLLYWSPLVPITATSLFLPSFHSHPLVLQYAMRSLESHPVDVTFFYVPQVVQVLRYDSLGYVRRFIIETAKLSQLFAHQIIWNFDANAYKDEDATVPDGIKPTLDSIKAEMMSNLSGADKIFYETEFRFFGEVTSISGKLKPYIKKSKPEKKAKIDEEMALIKVEQGVYLPSNPDGHVIDIDRKSGRPLQSHAKAPFMATFKIRKSRQIEAAFEDDLQVPDNKDRQSRKQQVDVYEKMQSAIFKVGDDCRQDVLALQLISAFRSIFNSIGLDLYVFPYRVTATAPGCGVIDVLPNSISRDMLGREAVNGLYDYFVTTFGNPETVAFQKARMNFVKSLAAYSVITYLLQFKDRHNGNIMYDAEGHVLHIDFGFCFDIAPGGITFESAPFKLTTEMIAVMGGSVNTQSYKMFQELSIKAFLVARQYSEQIIQLVTLMLDSGLPCFKGQTTITNLRNRFHLEATEHQASTVMLNLIAHSHQNQRTVAYDVFQKMTNGIPY